LGNYFAFDWNGMILNASKSEAVPAGNPYWVFLVPAVILVVMFFIDWVLVRDEPAGAGHENFDLGDATSGEDDTPDPLGVVVKRMLGSSVILTIAGIEFCSGYLRNATMHWGSIYSKQTGIADQFVFQNWGLMMCCAGIMAGMFSGIISDYVFNSRRGPVAAILYFGLTVGSGLILALLGSPAIGWALIFMQLCVIGVHGMLSGTASADFGGKKNAGVAVGLIDACVYLGTGTQSFLLGAILPDGEAAKDPSNWTVWPIALMPLAIVGTLLALRIWNAKPQPTKAAAAT
jgi:OPA family glycerol-3-phosphate transporter-like MFS transporter